MIIKFQQGGASLPPLVSYQPVMVQGQQAAESSGSSESSKEDLTDKDLLSMLKDLKGLPSDTQLLLNSLQNFYIDQQYGAINTSNIASRYLQVLSQMKVAQFNRDEYDSAFDIVKANGGINEYAISDRGQLFCVNDKGNFQLMSLDEIQDSGYQPLTNSELLQYRAYSPDMAFKNNILSVVRNGIGIETVTKMIQSSISNLGTTINSNDLYANTQANQLITGLNAFMEAQKKSGNYNASVDNLYKGNMLTKDQAQQAQSALTYIYSTLPTNAKVLLKTKTENGTDKEAINLVASLVNSRLSYTNEFSLDVDTPKKDGSSEDSKRKNDLVTSIQAGNGGHETVYQLDNKQGIGMSIPGTAYEQVKDTDGNHVGRTSVENLLNASGLRSIINADNGIFFGNQRVDLDSLLNIAYDGKGIIRLNLPIKQDGSPNFELLEEYSKAQSEFLLTNQKNEDRKKIFGDTQKYPHLNSLITQNGEFDKNKMAPFIIVSGITTDGLVNIEDTNQFITQVQQTPDLVKQIKTSLAVGSGKNTTYPDIDTYDGWWAAMDWFGAYDKIIKGNIYIPLNMNKVSAVLGGNQKLGIEDSQALEQEYQDRNINFMKLDPSILNN